MLRRQTDVYYDEGLEGWIKTTAYQEHWRLRSWYSVEDLVQDGYICYCKCRNRYTLKPPEPGYQDLNTDTPSDSQRRHFMSLVQRTFFNHIMTLSSKFTVCTENTLSELSNGDDPLELENLVPVQPEEASVLVAVLHAPTEIGEAIGKLLQDAVDGEKYLRSKLRANNGRITRGRRALRETTRERLARVLGDPEMQDKIRDYIVPPRDHWETRLERALSIVLPSSL